MSKTNFGNIKIQTPVSLLIHGANFFGFTLAKTLLEQGSKVIIIDDFNSSSKEYINRLKKIGDSDFIDFKGIEDLYKNIERVDYIYYLQNTILLDKDTFSSKEFLDESNYLNLTLKNALQNGAKMSLLTTIKLNKMLSSFMMSASYATPSPYSSVELQKYCETLTAEYHDKSKLNVRIIRMGTVLGKSIPLSDDSILHNLVQDCVHKDYITIHGEGLDSHYIINITDAVYGTLKITFTDKSNGEVVSLAENKEYTTLSLAYKLLELNPQASEIKFVSDSEKKPVLHTQYVPAPNATIYGWATKVSLDETLIEVLKDAYEYSDKKWQGVEVVNSKPFGTEDTKPKTESGVVSESIISKLFPTNNKRTEIAQDNEVSKTQNNVTTVKTPLGKFIDKITKPFKRDPGKTTGKSPNFKNIFKGKNLTFILATSVAVILLFYFLLGPIINIGVGMYLSYRESSQAMASLKEFNMSDAKTHIVKIQDYLDKTNSSFTRLKWLFSLTGKNELYENTSSIIYGAIYAANGANELADAAEPLVLYARDFKPALDFNSTTPTTTREYRDYLTNLDKNKEQINKAAYNILLATQFIDSVKPSVFPKFAQNYILELKKYNSEISNIIIPAQKLISFLPQLLGVNDRQTYLILLQNQTEQRSTGGWISSYVLLGIDGGQIRELYVDDVYNAEGTLKTQGKLYNAPSDMQKALDIKYWSLSTSNWDPDFTQAANDAEFFVKETGKTYKVDGVITIDVNFIKNLIDIWGGIDVPGESEKITKDNLYAKIFEIHDEFTPGATVKSTFLANLANETIKKLLSSEPKDYLAVSNVLMKALDEKDILVYLKNGTAYDYFSSKNWSGNLKEDYKSAPILVDWNWGGNKANLFLKKNSTLNMSIQSENEIRYSYNVAVQNTSLTNTYPQGDYKNFMRVLLPLNADVQNVKGFENGQYDITENKGFKEISGWFNVAANTTKTFEISYILKRDNVNYFPLVSTTGKLVLNLDLFKQPGSNSDDKVKIEIGYPDNYSVVDSQNFNSAAGLLQLQDSFSKDQQYTIEFKGK